MLDLVFMLSLCASSMHSMHLLVITFPCLQSPDPLQSLQRRRSLPCSQSPLPPIPSAAQSLQKYPCRPCGQVGLGHGLHVPFLHLARVVPCGHVSRPAHFLHVSLIFPCSHATPPLHRAHLMIGMSCSQYPAARHWEQLNFHIPCGQQLHSLQRHRGSTPCGQGNHWGPSREDGPRLGERWPGLALPRTLRGGFRRRGGGFLRRRGGGFLRRRRRGFLRRRRRLSPGFPSPALARRGRVGCEFSRRSHLDRRPGFGDRGRGRSRRGSGHRRSGVRREFPRRRSGRGARVRQVLNGARPLGMNAECIVVVVVLVVVLVVECTIRLALGFSRLEG